MRNLDYHTLQINPEKLEQPEAGETRLAGREEPSREEKKTHSAPQPLSQKC